MLTEKSKLAFHLERLLRWQQGDIVGPVTIDCALTQKCNLHCAYCYAKLQQNDGKIEQKDFSRFLKDAAAMDVKGISLISDGESTCVPWWPDALKEGLDHGIDMAIGTNGILFTKEKAKDIIRRLSYVRFNISSGRPERYREIHGAGANTFDTVVGNIRDAVACRGNTTIGMQMVFRPEYIDELIPLAALAIKLGVQYLVIKHCSDDEKGSLGVDYEKTIACLPQLEEAEAMSTKETQIFIKKEKILCGNNRPYKRCFAPTFIPQISGSGLIAPCGMFFHPKYKKYHMGYLKDGFKNIWCSQKAQDILKHLRSDNFNAQKECGHLCLQHATNIFINDLVNGKPVPFVGEDPPHVNFI